MLLLCCELLSEIYRGNSCRGQRKGCNDIPSNPEIGWEIFFCNLCDVPMTMACLGVESSNHLYKDTQPVFPSKLSSVYNTAHRDNISENKRKWALWGESPCHSHLGGPPHKWKDRLCGNHSNLPLAMHFLSCQVLFLLSPAVFCWNHTHLFYTLLPPEFY